MKIEAEIDKVIDYRKRPKKIKPFILEFRWCSWIHPVEEKWGKWKAYATIRDRDKAFEAINRKNGCIEVRIPSVK